MMGKIFLKSTDNGPRIKLVVLLIDNGLDLNTLDEVGVDLNKLNIIHLAKQFGANFLHYSFKYASRIALVLMDYGIDINQQDNVRHMHTLRV